MLKTIIKFLLPILLLSSGVGVFAYLKSTRPQQAPAKIEERIWQVAVQIAEPQAIAPLLTLYGEVETPDLLQAAAPGNAVVEQVFVREGQAVKKGTLLIQLDQGDFQPQVDQAKANVAELEAKILSENNRHQADLRLLKHEEQILALAKANVKRVAQLKQKQLGSESALDEAQQQASQQALTVTQRRYQIDDHSARLKQLEAGLLRAKAALAQAELDAKRSKIIAPFDAIIAKVQVASGDQVTKSQILLWLYAVNDLEIRARIPMPYRDELQRALQQKQQISGQLQLDQDTMILLHLDRLSGQADPTGVDGLFQLEQGHDWLRLGEMVQFQLQRPVQPNAIVIPYQALYGGNRIYRLRDERMQSISVKPLGSTLDPETGEELLVIASDLIQSGDQLIITHLPNAVSGLRVEAIQTTGGFKQG